MTEKVLYPYFKSIIDMDQCAVVVCNLVHRSEERRVGKECM